MPKPTPERLRRSLRALARQVPPEDWKYSDSWGDYKGYGNPGDPNYVSGVDMSNSGDVHDHGYAVGLWATFWKLVREVDLEAMMKEEVEDA